MSALDENRIKQNVELAPFTYLKVGGIAKYFIEVDNKSDLIEALKFAEEKKISVYVFGHASNLIFPDELFDGLVIRLNGGEPAVKQNKDQTEVTVFAGMQMTALARFAAKNSLTGLEWAYGLPGTVGGAVRGNAGCYGGETKDILSEVIWIDGGGTVETTQTNTDCQFDYRHSIFKKHPERIIIEVVMSLSTGNEEEITTKQNEILSTRNKKFPHSPNTGSFFKNIRTENLSEGEIMKIQEIIGEDVTDIVPTGLLLDKLGLKGKKRGSAQISEEHGNILVNTDKTATAADFEALRDDIIHDVESKTGVILEPEVQIVKWPK